MRFSLALTSALLLILSLTPVYGLASKKVVLYPIADSYVDSSNPDNNYGGSTSLFARHLKMEYGPPSIDNTYLMFDLASLPPGAAVESASLTIYVFWVGSTTKVYLHFCQDVSWGELEINWRNAPKYLEEPVSVTIMAKSDEFYSMDATKAVKQALAKGLNKLTLVVTTEPKTDIGDFVQFNSKESKLEEYRPKLEIAYSMGARTETTVETVKTAPTVAFTRTAWATVTEFITITEARTFKEVASITVTQYAGKPSPSFMAITFIAGLAVGLLATRLIHKPKGIEERPKPEEAIKELEKYCPSCGGELRPLGATGKTICPNCGRIYEQKA